MVEDLALDLGWQYKLRFGKNNKLSISIIVDFDAGKAAQQVNLPVPEGCTDPSATNYDPTARSDDGSCVYRF